MLGTVLKELRKEKRKKNEPSRVGKDYECISTNYRSMGNRACYPWR